MAKRNKDLKDFLKKLQQLAERGVGGEKETAQKKLDKLLKANNLTVDDLNENSVQYFLFSYNGAVNKKLLCQCVYKTLGAQNSTIYKSRGTRNKIGAYCTPAQKIEIELDFEFYRNLFDEEVDILLDAFIQKQDIFPSDSPINHMDLKSLSQDDLEKLNKSRFYQQNITKRKRAAANIEDKKRKKK